MKQLSINVPLVEALKKIPGYAMFMKDLVIKRRPVTFEADDRMHFCSDIATRSLIHKKEDSGAFVFPCRVGSLHFAKALGDQEASINLMTLSIYKKLGLGDPKLRAMRLLIGYPTMKRPIGILHNMLLKVESLIFPADFVILDFEVPIILGRPFLDMSRDLVYMEKKQMKFLLNNEEVTFNICRSMRYSRELQLVSAISYNDKI